MNSRKPPRTSIKSPSPQEINALWIAGSQGRYAEAAALARTMTARFPQFGYGWTVLGAMLKQMGRDVDALAAMRKAEALTPNDVEIHYNLGLTLNDLGRLDEAVASYRRALEIKPDYAEAHYNLGNTLKELGRLDEAEASYRWTLQIRPDDAAAHNNLGLTLHDLDRLDEAEACYRRALEIRPDDAGAHYNLGNTLQELGQLDGAVASYRRALQIWPDYAEAHNNLGNALNDLGRLDEAEACYRSALQIKPDYAEAHNNLGNTLTKLGRLDEAVASYRRVLAIKPDHAEAHNNLSCTLNDLGRLDDAVASCRRALAIKPDYAEAHSNLGNAFKNLGQLDDAVASFRRALEIKPDFEEAYSNLLFCLIHGEAANAQEQFSEHCRFAEQFEAPLRSSWPQHTHSRNPDRCLQVGFVSGDFRNHAVANFIEPVLAHLAGRPQLSLHAYYNYPVEDRVTQRLRRHITHWHPIVGLSDVALAQKIREDGIDILIDLSGHTGDNCLLAFARKPAPVQISWMGYPGTTGLNAMDYYLADRYFLPPGQFDDQFTEKIVRLPASAPFLPFDDAPPVNALPALGNGYVTFGSFNHRRKLSSSVIVLWSQILRALPSSRMVLGAMPQAGGNDTLIEWFAREGIARERLSFYPGCPIKDYLGLHHQVDLCLDAFPYPGGTTSCHALWMGVPTLTMTGSTPASRQGAVLPNHVGLEAFVARNKTEFVEKGLFWADHLTELAKIRDGLRERFGQSAMGRPDLIAEALERALRTMWQRWCAGLPAESFEVNRQDMDNAMQEANT